MTTSGTHQGAYAHTLLGMRCAHPKEFVPQRPSDNASGNPAP